MAIEITQQDWMDLWEIVRATERQTSVQNESIKGLCDKLDTQSGLTDRYFEVMDKRVEDEARKFDEHMRLQREWDAEQARRFDALIKSQEDREVRFWKAIAVLIGAILILAAGDARIDNAKFKHRFGMKARMLSADKVEPLIGHGVGGVCPFGVNAGIPVYLDESLKRFDIVYPAAGTAASAVMLTLSELERASEADGWVDVTK